MSIDTSHCQCFFDCQRLVNCKFKAISKYIHLRLMYFISLNKYRKLWLNLHRWQVYVVLPWVSHASLTNCLIFYKEKWYFILFLFKLCMLRTFYIDRYCIFTWIVCVQCEVLSFRYDIFSIILTRSTWVYAFT